MININLKNIDPKIIKKISRVSFGVFCICFMVQFYLSNKYAVKNDVLKKSLKKTAELKKEIAQLEYENSRLSSLDNVEQKAKHLGFVPMEGNLLTVGPVTVASLVNH